MVRHWTRADRGRRVSAELRAHFIAKGWIVPAEQTAAPRLDVPTLTLDDAGKREAMRLVAAYRPDYIGDAGLLAAFNRRSRGDFE